MSKQFHVLVVGVGSIGERHLRCFQNTGRCEMDFCEPNEKLRATIADRYGLSRSFADVDAALNEDDYDIAVIAAPAPYHVPVATQLAERGIHLLIEKPLSISMDGVQQLRQIVLDQSITVGVGYTHRANPIIQGMKEAIDSGRFGKPRQLVSHMEHPFYHFRPAYGEVYFARPEMGGGGIQDAMTHAYNLGEWLVGKIDRIVTDAAHLGLEGVEVEDTVHSLTRQGDLLGIYALNLCQTTNNFTITIVCELATCRIEYATHRWSWMDEPDGQWNHETFPEAERDSLYTTQATALMDGIEGQGQPLCSLDDGIQTLRVNLASVRSHTEGTWQDVSS